MGTTTSRMWADTHSGGPIQTESECKLLSLPPPLLAYVWPAERGVAGLRVCKQLRRDLLGHCTSILLVKQADATVGEDCVRNRLPPHLFESIRKDFIRLPPHLMVGLTCKNTGAVGIEGLADVLG
eukprot:618879-Rhodomonas_salina.1